MTPPEQAPSSAARPAWARRALPVLVAAALAALLLGWRVGARALWQDEAACALMAERMLAEGKPLAYGERGLITMDEFQREEEPGLARRMGDARSALDYYAAKGDFKADTTWIGQPWGQFAWTAASLALLGKGTLQARLPFVLAGVACAAALFAFARRRTGSAAVAWTALVLCLGSAYWVLHVRQCRYYAMSSLFLLLTAASYFRWQDAPRRPGRAALFVACGWVWFQQDFGTFWPVVGVLAADALVAAWREGRARVGMALAVFAALGLSVVPFAFLYELVTWSDGHLGSGRFKKATTDLPPRLAILAVYLNQFQLPFVLAPLALVLARVRGARAPRGTRVALVSLAILAAVLVWMAAVTPFPFYRYLVATTPLASLVAAWVLVEGARALVARRAARTALAGALALLVLVTPWAAAPARALLPVPKLIRQVVPPAGGLVRHELDVLALDLGQALPDPNGEVVRTLQPLLRPGDEVATNYEDVPLMFYLDCPVRGGIACFRLEAEPPPRFLVLRRSVGFTHQEPYQALLARRRWRRVPTHAPDVTWGNNPDPWCHWSRQLHENRDWGTVSIFEDLGPREDR